MLVGTILDNVGLKNAPKQTASKCGALIQYLPSLKDHISLWHIDQCQKELPHALSICAVSFLLEKGKPNSYSFMLRTILAFIYLKKCELIQLNMQY